MYKLWHGKLKCLDVIATMTVLFLQLSTSECDFGQSNHYDYLEHGVLGVTQLVTTATAQLQEELGRMTAATLVHVHEQQYLYVALTSATNENKIVKVLKNVKFHFIHCYIVSIPSWLILWNLLLCMSLRCPLQCCY